MRRWRDNKKATLTLKIQRQMLVNVTSMTKQSFGKALKKVNKSLPQSPQTNIVVVKALAKSFQLVTDKKKTGLEILQQTKELVKAERG